MSLTHAFNPPVTVPIGSVEYKFAVLRLNDLAAVGRAILDQQKDAAVKSMSLANVAAIADVIARFDAAEMDIEEMSQTVRTTGGAKRFIAKSAELADGPALPDDWADRFADEHGALALVRLATQVSGIFKPVRPTETKPPNPGAAAPQAGAAAPG